MAGYSLAKWRELESDLRSQFQEDAVLIETTQYGEMYHIKGKLTGPNGKVLNVITVWIRLSADGETRFVTLAPDKEAKR